MKKYQSIIKWMIFIVCIAAPNVHAKKRPITLEQTVMANRVASSEISPDGQHIAYTLSVPRTVM
ncbi:MAG: hypothetical protein OEY19_12065 [Gammaproteobacteria bacterium]|nr:hypothetical protein [Gammaproteobacteria bacterium]